MICLLHASVYLFPCISQLEGVSSWMKHDKSLDFSNTCRLNNNIFQLIKKKFLLKCCKQLKWMTYWSEPKQNLAHLSATICLSSAFSLKYISITLHLFDGSHFEQTLHNQRMITSHYFRVNTPKLLTPSQWHFTKPQFCLTFVLTAFDILVQNIFQSHSILIILLCYLLFVNLTMKSHQTMFLLQSIVSTFVFVFWVKFWHLNLSVLTRISTPWIW